MHARTCSFCGGELKAEILGGLCPRCVLKQANADDFQSDASPHTPRPSTLDTAARFGDYELLEKIGEGGMGVVYRARQISLNRIVAVKMIQPGRVGSPEMVLRFRAEAEAAAGLHHPNIVPIHETGECEGQHFFSMDYIEGQNLTDAVRGGPLPATRAAQLLGKIAAAVHYAHEHHILHRDLKPSNVIVDELGEPHVTDFGLAKRLTSTPDSRLQTPDLTLTGQVFGSPRFMPPEQASGRRGVVGPHSDVYGLGAILYYLITGRPPFVGETLETTLAQVLEQDPVSPRLLNGSVPRDLETICLKCLEKEPSRRYASAQLLADELGRFLKQKPILARPVGILGKTVRWCRRKPALAAALSAVVWVTAVGLTGVLSQWRQAVRAQTRSELESYDAAVAEAQLQIEQNRFDRARKILGREEHAPHRGWEWGWLQRQCNLDLMRIEGEAPVLAVAFSPDGDALAAGGYDSCITLWDLEKGHKGHVLKGHTQRITCATFSPDGRRLVTSSFDTTARIWDVASGRQLSVLQNPDRVFDVAISPDSKMIATAALCGGVLLWDLESGNSLPGRSVHDEVVAAVAFSPNGKRLAIAGGRTELNEGADASISVFDLVNWQRVAQFKAHHQTIVRIRFSPDGTMLASTSMDGTVRLSDAQTGDAVQRLQTGLPGEGMFGLDFSPDGRWLAACGVGWKSGNARVFDVATGEVVRILEGHSIGGVCVRFSPDGRKLVTAGYDGNAQLWPTAALPEYLSLEGHDGPVWSVAFARDGKRLASASLDQTARVWDSRTGECQAVLKVGFPVVSLAFSPDGKRLVTPAANQTAKVWNTENGQELFALSGHTGTVMAVAWSPNDRTILTGAKDNTARLWDADTGTALRLLSGHSNAVLSVAFSADGQRAITGSADHTARSWDTDTGQLLPVIAVHEAPVQQVLFSPDGARIVTGCADGKARLFEANTGRLLFTMAGHRCGISALALSPDGSRLVTTGAGVNLGAMGIFEHSAVLWDVRTGKRLLTLDAHQNWLLGAAFSPFDGRRLATSSADNTIRIREAFPWETKEFANETGDSLPAKLESFKRHYWQVECRRASTNEALGIRSLRPGRRLGTYYGGTLELNLAEEGGSKTRPAQPVPPRDLLTSTNCVDLTASYNAALTETWQPIHGLHELDRNLASLPAGFHTLAGVPFDVRGVIRLSQATWGHATLPSKIEIPVGRKFRRMHVLHGAASLTVDGERLGTYRLYYRDGSSADLVIIYGRDARDIWSYSAAGSVVWDYATSLFEADNGSASVSEAELAWIKVASQANPLEQGIRLYRRTYENPSPEREVVRISLESAMTTSGPFLVALSVEP